MKTKEEIEQLATQDFNDRQECGHYELADLKSRDYYYDGFCNAYTQCQEDMADKLFNNFYLRLKSFVSNVQVNDPMSEEEKEMIIYVCNKQLNKQD